METLTAQKIKIGSIVRYINSFADEKKSTFTVIEISEAENWCRIEANLKFAVNPTRTANINELERI